MKTKIKECVAHTRNMGEWANGFLKCRHCGKTLGWACGACDGSGAVDNVTGMPCDPDEDGARDCPECGGTGEVTET